MTSRPDSEAEARAQRLAAALRENLKRRKAQARGRQSDTPMAADPPADPDTAKPDERR